MNNTLQQKRKLNIWLKGILLIIGIFVFIIYYTIFLHQSLLISSKAPDNSYEIIIKYKEAFLFGPQEINVYYKKNQDMFKHHLFTTMLSNDGAAIDESNCEIKWDINLAEIRFTGDEQKPEVYEIYFLKEVSYFKIRDKYEY